MKREIIHLLISLTFLVGNYWFWTTDNKFIYAYACGILTTVVLIDVVKLLEVVAK